MIDKILQSADNFISTSRPLILQSADVHLAIATQRPTFASLGSGELANQLGGYPGCIDTRPPAMWQNHFGAHCSRIS